MKLSLLLVVASLCAVAQGVQVKKCTVPKCKAVPAGCKNVKLSIKNRNTGCLLYPCGITQCPRTECPKGKCPTAPKNCKWTPHTAKVKLSSGKECPKYPCGILQCKCVKPVCKEVQKGCKRVMFPYTRFKSRSTGCQIYPCGRDICPPVKPVPEKKEPESKPVAEKKEQKPVAEKKEQKPVAEKKEQTVARKPISPVPVPVKTLERKPIKPLPVLVKPVPEKREPESKPVPEKKEPEAKPAPEPVKRPKLSPSIPERPRPRMCCRAMTKSCLACSKGVSIEEFCRTNAGKFGCATEKTETPVSEKKEPEAKPVPEKKEPEVKPEPEKKEPEVKPEPEPVKPKPSPPVGDLTPPETEKELAEKDSDDLSANLCSAAVEFYSDCRYENKLAAGKVGLKPLNAKGVKAMVVPRGCRVQLFSKSSFSHAFTSNQPSHGLIAVGPKKLCLQGKLEPVAYEISHNANVVSLVNAVKERDEKTAGLARRVQQLGAEVAAQKNHGAELKELRSEINALKGKKAPEPPLLRRL